MESGKESCIGIYAFKPFLRNGELVLRKRAGYRESGWECRDTHNPSHGGAVTEAFLVEVFCEAQEKCLAKFHHS